MSESRVRENRTHGSRRRELEIGYGADIEALSTERESKPTRPTCSHYASSRPYLDRCPGLVRIYNRIGSRSSLIISSRLVVLSLSIITDRSTHDHEQIFSAKIGSDMRV